MILEAKRRHLNKIVSLHRRVLPNTSSSKFGFDFVSNLYSTLLHDGNSKVWIYVTNGKIIGFLSVTKQIKTLTSLIIKKFGLKYFTLILLTLIREPSEVVNFIKRLIFDNYILSQYGNYPSILTVGVSPKHQGYGVGSKLIKTSDAFFKKQQIFTYYVDTEETNGHAINFYKRHNFIQIKKFSGGVLLRKRLK